MILFISTGTERPKIALIGARGQLLSEYYFKDFRKLSVELVPEISKLLKQNKLGIDDLKGIIAYEGPGSFTGLRIGLSVANTLSYALDIPISGTRKRAWRRRPLLPYYGTKPKITKPKHALTKRKRTLK